MTTNVPTPDSLKDKAPIIRKFLREKYDLEISQGHTLELISQIFGFRDWNTASAASKLKIGETKFPVRVKTVGELKRSLAPFKDSDHIDVEYEFKIKDFVIEPLASPEDIITQEFSLSLEQPEDGEHETRFASFKLKLEEESLTSMESDTHVFGHSR